MNNINIGVSFGAFFVNIVEVFRDISSNVFLVDTTDPQPADVVIFTGGADINPYIYADENKLSSYSPQRDSQEIDVFNYCKDNRIPMIGICRGMQLINAISGGTLVQDLGLYGSGPHPSVHYLHYNSAPVEGITKLDNVNSLHHQGVDKVAKDFEVIASYAETPEFMINVKDKIICVQFHPEMASPWGKKFLYEGVKWILNRQ